MNNPFQIFTSPIFGDVRAAYIDGVAWFVGKDVCHALSYERGDMAIRRHVQEEDRKILFVATFQSMKAGKSVKRRTTVINESGLYSLVLASQMPAAQEFKHWVTSEVLPAIRENGSYSLFNDDDTPFNKKYPLHLRNAVGRDFKEFQAQAKALPEQPAQVPPALETPLHDFERAQFLAQFVPLLPPQSDECLILVKEIVKLTLGKNIF